VEALPEEEDSGCGCGTPSGSTLGAWGALLLMSLIRLRRAPRGD
jgi:MYXO-CTERM domain-containing protein